MNDTSTSTGSDQATEQTAIRAAPPVPPPVPPVLKPSLKTKTNDTDSEKSSESPLKIRKSTSDQNENGQEVDSEGYTIRKPERKESSASSSGWSSDEDGKPDTYKIKVSIRPAEEATTNTQQELVKLAAPALQAPLRSKPRPSRPSQVSKPTDSTLDMGDELDLSTKETAREETTPDAPLEQSTPKHTTTKQAPPPPPPPQPTEPTPKPTPVVEKEVLKPELRPISPLVTGEPRPMTPLITGGSLMGEINWSNKAPGAPLASVESLSPTSSTDSPYGGVDIPIRVAVTETLNVKFLGVGDQNTQIATHAEIYIDFGVGSIRFLNDNHQLLLKLIGQSDSIRVNPTFSSLETDGATIRFVPAQLKKSLLKITDEKPGKSQLMLKVASYRVKDTAASLPLLLLTYWRKEETGYRIQIVARASVNISQLRLLSKATFSSCEADLAHHTDEKGLLSFDVGNIAAGTERKISIFLRDCPSPSAVAAQFRDIDDRSSTSVESLASSNFKITYLRRRLKTGVFISEPIL